LPEAGGFVGRITTVGFDADDTLWHNEHFYRLTQDRFAELLADFTDAPRLSERLLAAERRNIGRYGFGIKGFMLSMIETAIEVTEGRVPGATIQEIIGAGQEMLAHPVELLPYARQAVEAAASDYRVVLITKGDLLDQERKLAESGLGELFDGIEIVSAKTPEVYLRIFGTHGDGVERALMVGNSMKSDILPVLEAGGIAVHVPHGLAWEIEHAAAPEGHDRFHVLGDLGGLAALLQQLGK
jgi:putative hydrolase of the HAD superfamily